MLENRKMYFILCRLTLVCILILLFFTFWTSNYTQVKTNSLCSACHFFPPSLQVASAGEEDCGQSEVTRTTSLLPNVCYYKGTPRHTFQCKITCTLPRNMLEYVCENHIADAIAISPTPAKFQHLEIRRKKKEKAVPLVTSVTRVSSLSCSGKGRLFS